MSIPRTERVHYYLSHLASLLVPGSRYRNSLSDLLKEAADSEAIQQRTHYYCAVQEPFAVPESIPPFQLRPWKGRSTYQLDLWESLRYFDPDVRIQTVFGDNITNPPVPSVVKSRPIGPEGTNGVLLKLNRIRHFRFVEDPLPFSKKKNRLVWRGNAAQPHRVDFLKQFYHHPLCDVGHYYHRPMENMPYTKPEASIAEQLQSKFILALEGNDVATNLKWVMSSNSLCVMPPPRYETWFMEGRLQPGIHYVEVAPDYSDLEEKLARYNDDPDAAEEIIRHANAWVEQFQDEQSERLIGVAVLEKYLKLSGQLEGANIPGRGSTGKEMLASFHSSQLPFTDEELDRIDELNELDSPPEIP